MHHWNSSLLFFVCLALFCHCKTERTEENPVPTDALAGELTLPEGFESTIVVDSLPGKARHLTIAENGDIYVKLRYPVDGKGNIALRDTNGDDRADLMQTFGVYKNSGPYGTAMKIRGQYLYFSSQAAVYRQKLKKGELVPSSPIDTIVIDDHTHGTSHEHIAKPLAFDQKGNMYVPFGAPSNNCQEPKRTPGLAGLDPCPQLVDHAGIWRFDAAKSGQTQKDGYHYATGIRSIVGMDWHPLDDALYAVVHGRDDLLRMFPYVFTPWQSAVLPSEEFIKVNDGANYGWPYCFYDQIQGKRVLCPEYGGDGKTTRRCTDFELPIIGFPGHWAPNDLYFYRGDQFPERYKQGAFIAFHGSTNRTPYPQSGYFVGFVPFENGRMSTSWEIFADGFALVDTIASVQDAIYRPMGIAEGPDGSLYISETEKGKIWRVRFTGMKKEFGQPQIQKMEALKAQLHIRNPDETKDNLQADKLEKGALVYQTYCSSCHQTDGGGATGRFPPLSGTDWVTGDKKRLIELVLNGMEGPIEVNGEPYNSVMPQHQFLSDEDIAEVLSYVRQNFGNQASAITLQEVQLLRKEID